MRVDNFRTISKTRATAADEQQSEPIDSGPSSARRKSWSDKQFGLKPEYAAIAQKICELGGTTADLAKAFGVDLDMIALWQSTSREFAEACRLGLDAAEQRVERALYEKATGYTHVVQTVSKQRGSVVIVPRKVPVPPDPRAAKIWLQRREAESALTCESPLKALLRQLEGTALRPKDQD